MAYSENPVLDNLYSWTEEQIKRIQEELMSNSQEKAFIVSTYVVGRIISPDYKSENQGNVKDVYSDGIAKTIGKDGRERNWAEGSGLEDKLAALSKDFSQDPKQIIEDQNYFSSMLENFYDNNLEDLNSFLEKYQLDLRYPQTILISGKDLDDTIAFTDGQSMIGASSNLKQKVKEMSQLYSINPKDAEEMVIAHELMHMSQPYEVLQNPVLAETHNEALLTKYFTEMANKSDGKEAEKYWKLADIAYKRMGQQYVLGKEHVLDPEINQELDSIYKEGCEFYQNNAPSDFLKGYKGLISAYVSPPPDYS